MFKSTNTYKNTFFKLLPVIIVSLVALPLFTVASFLFNGFNDNWTHLRQTVLGGYVLNSLWLMIGVSFGTLSMGVLSAWFTSIFEFKGRKFLSWALLLPLALPAYITAYTYTGLLDVAGPVQQFIRDVTGLRYGDYWFFEIRSLTGAIMVLSLVLYPYVYMMARAAFIEQTVSVLEASRILGSNLRSSFFKISIPLARPAIIAGLSLALMETLADFGTVQYFGVSTFTTGIFRTWFGLDDSTSAVQLSTLLLSFVFVLILLEKWSRKRAKFHHIGAKQNKIKRIKLTGSNQWLVLLACALPFTFGFVIPASVLLIWTFVYAENPFHADFFKLIGNTVFLALISTLIAIVFALFLAYSKRLYPTFLNRGSVQISSLGYAIPGTIIAVGVILPIGALDNSIDGFFIQYFGVSTGLLLSGSLAVLIFAYAIRFLSISIQAVEAGLSKIKPSMDESAQSLGVSGMRLLCKIHLPLMKSTVLSALLLVFVDVLKELPATLILRPFNFNTLAVRAYEMASDERLYDAAAPALAIVMVGIVPVMLLNRNITRTSINAKIQTANDALIK